MTLCFYKCRWCSQVFEVRGADGASPLATVNGAIFAVPNAPSTMTSHACELGRRGVADMIGAREEHERFTP